MKIPFISHDINTLKYFLVSGLWTICLSGTLSAEAQLTSSQKQALPNYFGFDEMEIYKLDEDISQLSCADMNGDGANDLVVANNYKSKIEVLLQRKDKPDETDRPTSDDVNELESDWRFERKSIPVNYHISSLVLAELTGDSYPDIVFFGEQKELVLIKNNGDGTFEAPISQRIRDGLVRKRVLAAGDLNGDGLTDVALLGEKNIWIFHQKKTGGLARPIHSAHAIDVPFALDLADINGDGRDDLIVGQSGPLMIRLQTESGQLGPQLRVIKPMLRTWEFLQCLGRNQADLIAVESVSGRLKRWQFEVTHEHAGLEQWPVMYYPYSASQQTGRRPLAIGDINGDGLIDLVAADAKSAQLIYYENAACPGLKPPRKFGGQINTRDIRIYDLDRDEKAEVFVSSADEKAIGVSHLHNTRLTFPQPLPTVGRPQAFDLSPAADGWHMLAYVTEEEGDYYLVSRLLKGRLKNNSFNFTLQDDQQKIRIEDFATAPTAVRLVDANQDGLTDVLIFAPYETLVTFLQSKDGAFQRLQGASTQEGLVKEASIEGFDLADVTQDGLPEIILAQRSFARALKISQDKRWTVVDQFNAPSAAAEITGVTAIPRQGQRPPHIALYDKRTREIHWLTASGDQTYEVAKSLDIGDFELTAMMSAQLYDPETNCLLLADAKKFAVVLPNQPALSALQKAVYETNTKDGRLMRPAVGDLNHDDRSDIAVTEAHDNQLEILTFGPQQELLLVTRFKVFSKKQFHSYDDEANEPREVLIRDLNNDGHDDLAIIVHDRVIVYPAQ